VVQETLAARADRRWPLVASAGEAVGVLPGVEGEGRNGTTPALTQRLGQPVHGRCCLLGGVEAATLGWGWAGVTLARLIGQSAGFDPAIGKLLGDLGYVGVLVWFLWYHTTHSYPQMMAKFAEEQKAMREAFEKEQAAQRLVFQQEQAAQREFASGENRELRNMLIENMRAMRSAVHDVKDTAQKVFTKADLAMEQMKQGQPP
jgi:hypothetical protein